MVDIDELQVVLRIRNATERWDWGEIGEQRLHGGSRVERDPAKDRRAGELPDVLGPLHAGVEQLSQHGQPRTWQEPEYDGEPQVADRLRRHR